MDSREFASRKHLFLLPNREVATFRNLIKELSYRRDISKSILLHHNISEEKENKYLHKGFILVSLFVQIFLEFIAERLKKFGSKIEHFLNRDVIQWKDSMPLVENSEGYISFLGHIDSRIELDNEIKHGDGRYYPALSMMAAKLAYENASVVKETVSHHWKMEYVDFYNCYNEFLTEKTTQAFIMRDEKAESDMIILAFRGTSAFDAKDWSTDFDISWLKINGMGKVHKGFMIAMGLKKYLPEYGEPLGDYYGYWPKQIKPDPEHPLAYYTIRDKLRDIMAKNKKAKFIVTGHSLGGALAILFPAILALHKEVDILDRLEAIYTYGQPRVGNEKFGQFVKRYLRQHSIKYYRIVYGYDVVPRVPFGKPVMTFKHFGTCISFNSLYQGKIVDEEQKPTKKNEKEGCLKKYVRRVLTLMRWVLGWPPIAVWQLIRGLIIGFTAGPDFREGWLLLVARLFAIPIPWFIDHNPQDYVNATRLASEDLFINYPALPSD